MVEKETVKREGSNYAWLINQNLSSYEGLWIAVINQKIVAKGKDAKVLMDKVFNEFPKETPLITLIPSKKTLAV